nr:Chloramphenicol phosphotransferase-like protein [uncultured bacterium]
MSLNYLGPSAHRRMQVSKKPLINKKPLEKSPIILLLNGPSSSGKSTLAELLQSKLKDPFLHIGIDKMIAMMPDKINNWEGGQSEQGFWWEEDTDSEGHQIYKIKMGPYAQKVSQTYKEVVVTLAKNGHNIIVDEVAFGNKEIEIWREKLSEFNAFYIGIHCPLPTLEEREIARGDRIIGSARHQFYTVHEDIKYDLEVDTETHPLQECAERIISLFQ